MDKTKSLEFSEKLGRSGDSNKIYVGLECKRTFHKRGNKYEEVFAGNEKKTFRLGGGKMEDEKHSSMVSRTK
jgi:hypothetical protein